MVLQLLPRGAHINIIAFGSKYKELFFKPTPLTEETATKAKNFLNVCSFLDLMFFCITFLKASMIYVVY